MAESTIKCLLEERGMSIRQFAMMAGVPYTTMYDVAHGKRSVGNLTVSTARSIADALGMSIEQLLNDEPPTLTANEAELLAIFRSLPPYAQRMLLAMARNVAEGVADE